MDLSEALQSAFPFRRPLLPWAGYRLIEQSSIEDVWNAALCELGQSDRPNRRTIYIHIPFCANHCLFCGFYKNRAQENRMEGYVDRLIREMERQAHGLSEGGLVHAVYLGGGTPTALGADELFEVVSAIRRLFPLANDCEITVEGRVIHFTEEKIEAALEAGVNRFSIGVQSFDTLVRNKQGRRSSRKEVLMFLESLLARDRATVVFDLMFGLPLQTRQVWMDDLETAIALKPDGIDIYSLALFPGTPLFKAIKQGSIEPGASRQELGEFYAMGVESLSKAGWLHLSNSHFASGTRERNRYNIMIKEGAETLGFGSGAGGAIGRYSYQRNADLDAWSTSVDANTSTISQLSIADENESTRAMITGQLEQGRLDLTSVMRLRPVQLQLAKKLEEFAGKNLITNPEPRTALTLAGRYWSTNIRGEILQILNME